MREGNDFKFSVNLLKTETDKKGNRYVYGVASSESVDSDGAIVEATGLKKSAEWYLKNGIIDWDHRTQTHGDPGALIGKPEKLVWDDKNRAHFKGKLYKTEQANKVWDLLNDPEAENQLGFSVGGKILEQKKQYDPTMKKNVTRISKVFLNHIAITPFPANKDAKATSEEYADFFKSLSASSSIKDEEFDMVESQETEHITELKTELNKALAATGNPPCEGTGGVEHGGNVQAKESLEATPKDQEKRYDKEKKRGKRVVLNKNLTIEFSAEDDAVFITTDNTKEVIKDKELNKASKVDATQVASAYIDLMKSMSRGDKEAQDVDAFLKTNYPDMNRKGRRIIKRHLLKRIQELFTSDEFIQDLAKGGYDHYSTKFHSNVRAMSEAYTYDGVVKGAHEDPHNIPSQEASTPTDKQIQTALGMQIRTEDQVKSEMCCEIAECTPDEADSIRRRLQEQEYDLMSDAEVFKRYNSIRQAYGMPKIQRKRFNDSLRENRWDIMNVIKRYDEMLTSMIEDIVSQIKDFVASNQDNNNVNPMDTVKIKDFKEVW